MHFKNNLDVIESFCPYVPFSQLILEQNIAIQAISDALWIMLQYYIWQLCVIKFLSIC